MPNFVSTHSSTTDAADIIPARLGNAAMAAVFVGTGGMMISPIVELPTWIPVFAKGQAVPKPQAEGIEPMSPPEANLLMQLDEIHNPLLADLWRDDINDGLVDGP